MINLKYVWYFEKIFEDTLDSHKVKKWALDLVKPELPLEAKNDKTEAVLIWVYHEKARIAGGDNNARKS